MAGGQFPITAPIPYDTHIQMRNVLLIGGQALNSLAKALTEDGFVVSVHHPGDDGAAPDELDAVVLELASAGEDALARKFLEMAQAGDAPPVIGILGADRLGAYDPALELDDFVLSSAPPEELSARVRQAVWKRHRVDTKNVLRCGDLVMDLANYTVHVAGKPVELTYKEYELLRYLAQNQGRVVNRETLLSKVWGYDFYGGARTVDVHIRRLRAKIEDRHNTFVETVRNVGYRFRA
jgi:DNA-binding response OmpR family regulator